MKQTYLFLVIVFLTSGLIGCEKEQASEKNEVIRPVVVYTVQDYVEGRIRSFTGTAKAALKTFLSFQVGGKLTEVNVDVGDQVRPGDVIARIDDIDYRVRVKRLEAELARVEASLVEAKASYERINKLYKTKITSKSEYDEAQARYKSMLAFRDSSREALRLSRKQLEYTILKAPIKGDISEIRVEVHQVVQTGEVIAVMTSRGSVEMEIGVPERLIGDITKGAKARVAFDALPDNEYGAIVKEVGVAAKQSSTFPVILKMTNAGEEVKPGMAGEATFLLDATPGDLRVLVPLEAVVGEPGKIYHVWVVDPINNTVAKRPVKIGNLTSEGLQIKEGLKPGEVVVIRGVNRMEEGMKVRLLDKI